MDLVVNLGYVLMLGGFLLRDVLWLRGVLAVGQCCVAIYGGLEGRVPMAFWNGLFACINAAWAGRIYHERRPTRLPDELRDLHETVFSALSPKEFLAFWALGWDEVWGERVLVREGTQPDAVHLVLDGTGRVERGGRTIARLTRGSFMAEMSFLTGQPASADIHGENALRTRAWAQAGLRALREARPPLYMKLQGILGCDLAAKVRGANAAMTAAEPGLTVGDA